MKKVIAHIGTHGTGKTLAAMRHAVELKLTYPRLSVGILTDTARGCPFPISQDACYEGQIWILCEHIRRALELSQRYDLIVADRSIYDVAAYSEIAGIHEVRDLVVKLNFNPYSLLILHDTAHNNYLHDDGLRDTCPKYREAVEQSLLGILEEANVRYVLSQKKGGDCT